MRLKINLLKIFWKILTPFLPDDAVYKNYNNILFLKVVDCFYLMLISAQHVFATVLKVVDNPYHYQRLWDEAEGELVQIVISVDRYGIVYVRASSLICSRTFTLGVKLCMNDGWTFLKSEILPTGSTSFIEKKCQISKSKAKRTVKKLVISLVF